MNRPRIALVINPTAGVGRAARVAPAVRDRLARDADVRLFIEQSPAGTTAAISRAVADCDAVVIVGGDGMVNIAAQCLAAGEAPLGIVPAGTGNDVADLLGLPRDPLAAADALLAAVRSGSTRRIDLGRTDGGKWWATVLCAGFDSAVNDRANRMRWPRGPRRYDVAIAMEALRLRPRPFVIELDEDRLEVEATLVAVGNGPQYGGGKVMCPHGSLDNGRFAVTVVGPVSRLTLSRLAPTLPRAGHIGHPAVTTYDAKSVRLSAPATVAYADGEPMGPLPVRVDCVPAALRVLVP